MLSLPQALLKAAFAASLTGRTFIRKEEEGFLTNGSIFDRSVNQSQTDIETNAHIFQFEIINKIEEESSDTEDESTINSIESSSAQKDVNNLISQITNAFDEMDISSEMLDDLTKKEQFEKALSVITRNFGNSKTTIPSFHRIRR